MIIISFYIISAVIAKLTHFVTLSTSQDNLGLEYAFSQYHAEKFAAKYFEFYSKEVKVESSGPKQQEQEYTLVCDIEVIKLLSSYRFALILQQVGFINAFCLDEADEVLRQYIETTLDLEDSYKQKLLKQNLTDPDIYQNISIYAKKIELGFLLLPKLCPNFQYYFERGLIELANDKEFQEIIADQYFLSSITQDRISAMESLDASRMIWRAYLLNELQQEQQMFRIDLKAVQQVSDLIYLQIYKYVLWRKEIVQLLLNNFIQKIKDNYQESKLILDSEDEITLLAFIKMMLTDEEISERRYELIPQHSTKLMLTFTTKDVHIQFNGINLKKISKCKSTTPETCTIDDFFNVITDYEIIDYEFICFI